MTVDKVEVADVVLWGQSIGAIAWDEASGCGSFEYTPDFLQSSIELSPLMMPLADRVYRFPELAKNSFWGLPGMLADCLPDKFGNLLIDQWLARQGRERQSFSPIERLCYLGMRGMGALEFMPSLRIGGGRSVSVEVDALVKLANDALAQRDNLWVDLKENDAATQAEAMNDIIRVGTSAGGARAKAVIALNESTGQLRSGQVEAGPGFSDWLIKFDGVSGNRDKELADPQGYGKIEYAYSLMAKAAGIEMTECRLLEENERSHFMTRRFDRGPSGEKMHMQTLCAMAHFDFNQAGAYSYEQAMEVMQRLGLPRDALVQQLRRMLFNLVARNQDDHTKNIAFLMNKQGEWSLSPAYDVTYSYNPDGQWTSQHQMTVNGKRDDFTQADLFAVGKRFNISKRTVSSMLDEIETAIESWPEFAAEAGVPDAWSDQIGEQHRLIL